MAAKKEKPIFDFKTIPPVGFRHRYFAGQMLTLEKVEPYKKKDGSDSVILTWVMDDGRRGTSGLRGKSLYLSVPA